MTKNKILGAIVVDTERCKGCALCVESIVMDAMFEAPTKNIDNFTVTLEYAKAQLEKSNLQ